jgi:hypothetical protein
MNRAVRSWPGYFPKAGRRAGGEVDDADAGGVELKYHIAISHGSQCAGDH